MSIIAKKSENAFGLDENVAGLCCYLLGWISGLVFFLVEKKNKVIRFHALQSLITFLVLWALMMILPFISPVIWVLQVVLWILLMVKAYQGQMYKLPIIGDIAEKQVNK